MREGITLHPANERRRYKVTPSLIGWAQTWNQPWYTVYPMKYPLLLVLLCFVMVSLLSLWIYAIDLPIFFRVTSLALGQSPDCPSASEVTLNNMGKIVQYQTTIMHQSKLELDAQLSIQSYNDCTLRAETHHAYQQSIPRKTFHLWHCSLSSVGIENRLHH